MSKVYIYYLPFPDTVNGAVHLRPDGSYIIGINENLDADARAAVLDHELEHIRQGHFFTDKPLREIEAEADAHYFSTL